MRLYLLELPTGGRAVVRAFSGIQALCLMSRPWRRPGVRVTRLWDAGLAGSIVIGRRKR